ncbi:MAG: hypothetical protein ACE15E_06405 [Acidobacteriota bacterium]
MRRILVVVLFSSLVVPALAQISADKSKSDWNTWGGTGFFFHPGSFRHRGFFPILPLHKGNAFFLSGFLFFGHRPTVAGPGADFLFGPSPYYSHYSYYPYGGFASPYGMQFFGYPGFEARPALYNSARFVEEWKDRDPIAGSGSESQDSALQESILLREGMDEDQVVQAIGSPVQRVQLGERMVWKYSAYSLLFENGKLKEIR